VKPHRVINVAIVTMAVSVVGFTSFFVWDGFRDYRDARRLSEVSAAADRLTEAAGRYAYERGLTAVLLGAREETSAEARRELDAWRAQSDRLYTTHAGKLAALGLGAPWEQTYEVAQRRLEALVESRRLVDRALAGKGPAPALRDWQDTSTVFIESIAQLWERSFQGRHMPHDLAQLNFLLRREAWALAEHAGRERMLLGYYLSARRPLPPAAQEEARVLRAAQRSHARELWLAAKAAEVEDARLLAAIERMQEHYFGWFERTRQGIYARAERGDYAMSGQEWLKLATGAIDSILAVSEAITALAHERTGALQRRFAAWFLAALLMLGGTVALAAASATRLRRTVNDLFESRERQQVTMDSIGDAVITTDAWCRVQYLNPVAEELTGWTAPEAKGRLLPEIFRIVNGYTREPKDNPAARCIAERKVVLIGNDTVLLRRDGKEFIIEDSAAPIFDRSRRVVGAVLVFYDRTSAHTAPHLLSYHATHDTLTGLVNRREFERRLTALIAEAKTRGGEHALLYFDLDQFKLVNDSCGHAAGDKLLRDLAVLLRARARATDTLARLGGDEFGLLLERCPLDKALEVANALLAQLTDYRFVWDDSAFDIGASIGVVPITREVMGIAEVLAEADAACYAAKEKGRGRIQVYRADDRELARRRHEMRWVTRLTQALDEDRFVLHCQPILALANGQPPHFEVLIRYRDAGGDDLILPGVFLPAAERYGLMNQIDRWVIRSMFASVPVCLERLAAYGPVRPVCNINLSAVSLQDPEMLEFVRREAAGSGIDPAQICFELTETAAVSNLELAREFILNLKRDGFRFALDDFGTGLSSFAYLKNLHVDYLKIAGEFVREIAHNPASLAMVQTVTTVGHALGLKVVAEYVATEDTLERLRALHVDYVQGYAVARPGSFDSCLEALGPAVRAAATLSQTG
jgi:diguanylate cyclase (GGDEF)-like protein/PAS domain S-box-containing protein